MEALKVIATKYSNHYIDWSRVAELIHSGAHRYSWQELISRGFIVTATAVSTYLGNDPKVSEQMGVSRTGGTILGFSFGFIASHTLVIAPLIRKRMTMSQMCRQYEHEIIATLDRMFRNKHLDQENTLLLTDTIAKTIDNIMYSDCSTESRGNASQTWGARKRKMRTLAMLLTDFEHNDTTTYALLNKITELRSNPSAKPKPKA